MKFWKQYCQCWAARAAVVFVALLLAAWAPRVRAQGTRKDDVVINSAGQPVGGATIRVCTAAATGTPCTPLANIYSDIGLTQPMANPLTADGLGNYYFYAAPGKYMIEISGTDLSDKQYPNVLLPNDPATVPAKPQASDSVEYVSPNGNDSNDGLSMGTAKLTIMAAYDALGQGGGTIYITGSSTSAADCTSTPGQGIWIMGSSDPNYASPPAGWRKMKTGGPVYFVGLSANTSPAASTTSWTTVVNCGSNTNPGVWLSGVSGVTISRLRVVSESVRVSLDSNGGRNNATNPSAQIEFDHDDFRSDCSGCGPTMDVGGNMLWLNVHDSTFENGAIANWSVSANSSQASNISISNGGGSGPIGLLYFTQNFFTGGGGLRFDANTNSSASIYAAHTLMEGAGACQPVYEIVNGGTFAATFDLQGGFSDCGASPPFVKVAAGNQPCQTSVRGINQGGQVPGLEGPLTVGDTTCPGGNPSGGVSISDAGVPSAGVIPAAKGQSGGAYGTSQSADAYRRSFAPSLVRFANTASQLPSTWTAYQGSGQTLAQIQGPGDPAGTTNAATLSCTGQSGFGCSYYVFDSSITFSAGDYVYVGAWMQAASTAGFGNGSGIGVIFPFGNGPTMRQMTGGPAGVGGAFSGGTTQLSSSPYLQNDGNWQYVWGLSKVTVPFSGASGTIFTFAFQPGFPINVYAPMFVRIPASSVAVVSAPAFSSASESGNLVTFTTSAAHNLSRGEPIVVSGCSISGYNGEFVLGNTITSTTFTVYNSATGLGSPTGCVITPGNDSEVADWANNLKPYSDRCSAGVLCGVASNPQISTSGLNSIIFVDGVTYPRTDAGVQAALNAAAGGSGPQIIYLSPGLYSMANPVTYSSANSLTLEGAGVNATELRWSANGGMTFTFSSSAAQLVASDFALTTTAANNATAISASWPASVGSVTKTATLRDLDIRSQPYLSNTNYWTNGISLSNGTNAVMRGLNISGASITGYPAISGTGINLTETVAGANVDNRISQCQLDFWSTGILAEKSMQGVQIDQSEVINTVNGIVFSSGGTGAFFNLTGNLVWGYATAIDTNDWIQGQIVGNLIYGAETASASTPGVVALSVGTAGTGSHDVTVTGNVIAAVTASGSTQSLNGIVLGTSASVHAVVTANRVSGFTTDLWVKSGATLATILGNDLSTSVLFSGTTSNTQFFGAFLAVPTLQGWATSFATKSSAYTLTTNDAWVNVTGTTTITVPHAITAQRWVVFNSGSNTVTVQADSGNINGAASITLAANTGKEVTCDGTNCFAH